MEVKEKVEFSDKLTNNKTDNNKLGKISKYTIQILLMEIILFILYFAMKKFNNATLMEIFIMPEFTIGTFAVWISGYLILKAITGKTRISLGIVVGIEALYDITNYFVRTIRGSSITISDITAINTALSVVKNVKMSIDLNFITAFICIVIIALIIIFLKNFFVEEKTKIYSRILEAISGIMIIYILISSNIYQNYSLWDINDRYIQMGTPLTIFRMAHGFIVAPPEGYDAEESEEILNKFAVEKISEEMENDVNIIVIINESFCDYYKLYNDGKADPIPYFRNLLNEENVISGAMYSSEFGGCTANVEYEFLTQNSLKILPIGSFVFQQYIKKTIERSIVTTLEKQGYKTSAIHPWENYAYSRNKIYSLFGFDKIKFKNDIEGLETTFNNEFITDKSTYRELINQINEKKQGEKWFYYVLTVQNHTGFNNPDPNKIIYNENNTKNVYMQLTNDSDEALKELIEELKNKDEKYILLFFGDHQPNLGQKENAEKDSIKEYEVPFIIWANYDIEEEYNIKTSTIFLQNYLLKAAGIKFSEMNNYMENLKKYYPIITKHFYINSENELFKNIEDESANMEKLKEYFKIDYYNIFSK